MISVDLARRSVTVSHRVKAEGKKNAAEGTPHLYAGMMKLVNMLDLGSSAARLVGSSPTTRTMIS